MAPAIEPEQLLAAAIRTVCTVIFVDQLTEQEIRSVLLHEAARIDRLGPAAFDLTKTHSKD